MNIKHFLFYFILVLQACGTDSSTLGKNEFESEDLKIEIVCPSGDIYPAFNQAKIPLFFNIAKLTSQNKKLDFIFPGERISSGKSIKVLPLAVLSFNSDTTNYKFVVSSAKDSSIVGLSAKNYMDFSINDYQTKELIEDWFKSNCKLGTCNSFRWDNELTAKNLVYQFVGDNK